MVGLDGVEAGDESYPMGADDLMVSQKDVAAESHFMVSSP